MAVAKTIDARHRTTLRTEAARRLETAAVASDLTACTVGLDAARIGDNVGHVFLTPLAFIVVPRITDYFLFLFAADGFH